MIPSLSRVTNLQTLPNGNIIGILKGMEINIWNPITGTHVRKITAHIRDILAMLIISDDLIIASGSHGVYILHDDDIITLPVKRVRYIQKLNHNTIVTGSYNNPINICNIDTQEYTVLRDSTLEGTTSLLVVNDRIFEGSESGDIRVYDTTKYLYTLQGNGRYIIRLQHLWDNVILSVSHNGTINIWDGKRLIDSLHLQDHDLDEKESDVVKSILVLPNRYIVIGSSNRNLYIYYPQNKVLVNQFEDTTGNTALFLLSDNRFVNVRQNSNITIWK